MPVPQKEIIILSNTCLTLSNVKPIPALRQGIKNGRPDPLKMAKYQGLSCIIYFQKMLSIAQIFRLKIQWDFIPCRFESGFGQ